MMIKSLRVLAPAALVALTALILSAGEPARAAKGISAQAYAEDASASLDFEAARKLSFRPFIGAFAKGYSNSAFWIRLTIDPEAVKTNAKAFDDVVILRVRPPYLREIEVFDPENPTERRRLSGDLHPGSGDEYRSFNLNFVLENGKFPRDIFIRLKTTSSTMSFFEAYHVDEIQSIDKNQTIFFVSYIAFLLVNFVLSFIIYIIYKDKLISFYALKQFLYIFWAFAVFGMFRYYTDNAFIPSSVYICGTVVLVTLASQLFDVIFFRDLRAPKPLLAGMVGLMGLPSAGTVFLIVGDVGSGMQITMLAVLTFPMVTAVGSFFLPGRATADAAEDRLLPKSVIIAAYGLIALLLMISALPQLGFFPGTSFSLYSNVAHSVASTGILSSVMFYRMVLMRKREAYVRGALAATRQKLVQEEAVSKERDMLISMLTHELRTPLAAIQMSLAVKDFPKEKRVEVGRAIQDINLIISRCIDASRIDAHAIHPVYAEVDVSELVRELIETSGQSSRFRLECRDEARIQTDRGLLQVVLLNLFENAQKYAPEHDEIRVSLQWSAGSEGMELTVANRLKNEEWPDGDKVFGKFYRGTHARRIAGSGLGLYIVKSLIEKLGGHVSYEKSEADIRFRVVLPC
jgi:signal transduction histidine kinase